MIHTVVMMMKISNSKKELARIVSENGGWRDGEFAAQDGDGLVGGYGSKPEWNSLSKYWWREAFGGWVLANKIKNHHQTVLSRTEYFHLYPAPGAKPRFCESVMRTIPEPEAKQAIEQLLQDWRDADDYAKRKQAEADDAAAMRDERWKELQARTGEMGVTVGLCESVAAEPEQVNPVKPVMTGKFRNAKIGSPKHYISNKGWSDEICDECGKRFGEHFDTDCHLQ